MKKGYAIDFPGSKVYFTEADPSAQSIYGINLEEFELKMKLWLLFSDHVILSAGHMLLSPLTFGWLSQNSTVISDFISENAVLPSLRGDREGFKEFVIEHPEQEDQPTLYRMHKKKLLERAALLTDIFPTAISWSPVGESHWFRDAMASDLRERDSPLRKRMVGISNTSIEHLSKSIASCEFLNREKLLFFVRTHCPERENLLLRYGDIFYYLSGALFKDAFPLLHPGAVTLCLEKVSYAASATHKNGEIWHDIIDTWGITCTALQRLPLSEIADIRRDPLGMRLRKTWGALLEKAQHAQVKKYDILAFQQAKERLLELFKKEVAFQRRQFIQASRAQRRLNVESLVTGGLGTLAGFLLTSSPILSAAVGILSFITGKPLLEVAKKKMMKNNELIILATKIQRGEWNKS